MLLLAAYHRDYLFPHPTRLSWPKWLLKRCKTTSACVELRQPRASLHPPIAAWRRSFEPVDTRVEIDVQRRRGCGGGNRAVWVSRRRQLQID